MHSIPFTKLNWDITEKIAVKGEKGVALIQTIEWAGLRVRMVNYSTDYLADHWCTKGHFVHCISGSFIIQLSTGEIIKFHKGESFIVTDYASNHLLISNEGAQLLIIDGEFLG